MSTTTREIPSAGVCRKCARHGPPGAPCPGHACAGLHFIPLEHAARAANASGARNLCGRIIGDYLLVEPIGQGGFGAVYLALKRPKLQARGALKLFDPAQTSAHNEEVLRRYFLREIRTLSELNEPNIVKLMDEGEHEGSPYLVMPYISGVSLRALMRQGQPAPAPLARVIIEQLLRALRAAHAQRIVHRDLKPENIMLQGELPHVYVLDFGLARHVQDGGMTTATFGTPYYMAPEQLFPTRAELFTSSPSEDAQRGLISPATDCYALGVIIAELWTGHALFRSQSTAELGLEKDELKHDPLRHIAHLPLPDATRAFLERALAYLPSARFQDAAQLEAAFGVAHEAHEAAQQADPDALGAPWVFDAASLASAPREAIDPLAETLAPAQHTPRAITPSARSSRPHRAEPLEPADAEAAPEPLVTYPSAAPWIALAAALVTALGITIALLVAQPEPLPSVSPTPEVVTEYDRALARVRRRAARLPEKLASGEVEQVISEIHALDEEEARLTPEEVRQVRALMSHAQRERPRAKALALAQEAIQQARYEEALARLEEIPSDSVIAPLEARRIAREAALDGLMKRALTEIALKQDLDAARTTLEALLERAPGHADARALLARLSEAPAADAPLLGPIATPSAALTAPPSP